MPRLLPPFSWSRHSSCGSAAHLGVAASGLRASYFLPAGRRVSPRVGAREEGKNMKLNVSRRGFLLGSASAAVLAGLAACNAPGTSGDPKKSKEPQDFSSIKNEVYKSDYAYTIDGEKQLADDQDKLFRQVVNEGVVLLRNEGNALPLAAADGKVCAFGNAGPLFMLGFDEAMKDAGFDFDDDAWEFYTDGPQNSTSWQVNENSWSDVKSSAFYAGLSGVAVVFLGRTCNEGCDAQWYEDHDYLALSREEKEMLSGVAELRRTGTFTKMVVVLCMSNNVSWEDGDWSDAIDSLLWMGNVSFTNYKLKLPLGASSFVDLLDGTANPSGRMPDSLYKNNRLNPVMANFGRIDADLSLLSEGKAEDIQRESDKWAPGNSMGNHWRHNYVYAEGIYVGYRYYETRYEDKVLGQGSAGDFDYGSYVAYPFGSGLSYTTFEYSDFSVDEGADDFTVNVTVTNTGSVAGKHAACVYVQSPYTDYDRANGVEKAAIELKGYEKTKLLDPGASEQLSVRVSKRELASYDANNAKTYFLDDGDYYFAVAGSSHEALNNVLAAKGKTVVDGMTAEGSDAFVWVWSNPDFDAQTFSTSVTGASVTNLFDECDPNRNTLIKGKNFVTWLSRADWEGTFPKNPISVIYTDELADLARPFTYKAGSGDPNSVPKHEFGQTKNDIVLADMTGKDYDDPNWEKLVSKLTYEEMCDYIINTEHAFPQVGKPVTVERDGSAGWGGSSGDSYEVSGGSISQYPSKDVLAATFSTEINKAVGHLTGENMLHSSNVTSKSASLLGWSCGTHRAPYSGRNMEYFSEDPYLGGRACAEETLGIREKGGMVYTKHVVGNDQEEYRHGVSSWANEQTMREIYLRQFEKAVTEGEANGLMTGFNRLGMEWAGECHALLGDFLEGELGYKGATITDNYECSFMDAVDGLLNGNHLWLFAGNYEKIDACNAVLLQDDYKNDPLIQNALFEAVHRSLYNFANSLVVNGLEHSTSIEMPEPLLTSAASGSAATMFYADKLFYAKVGRSTGKRFPLRGTWDYTDDGGLVLTDVSGESIEVSSDNGIFTWTVKSGTKESENSLSAYELTTACNEALGGKFSVGEKPSATITFDAGNDAVSGSDPSSITFGRGDKIAMPECPYQGENLEFAGWSIGGSTVKAGAEYAADTYEDLTATAVWNKKIVATAEAMDDYWLSYAQAAGIPMVLYADGTVSLNKFKKFFCSGTWEIEGAASGVATLRVLNEAGSPVALSVEGEKAALAQEAYGYDWHQPDQGFGSGVFKSKFVHYLDLSAFIKAYNEIFETKYDSVSVSTGSASFEVQAEKKSA